jgi:DNA-directed RNA polymerase subunit omega
MLTPAVESLVEKGQSRYSLVIAVAKRAREVAEENAAKGDITAEKPVKIAIDDFAQGKYTFIPIEDD